MSARPTDHSVSPTPPSTGRVLNPLPVGREVADIVAWAVRERLRAIKHGWSRVPAERVAASVAVLQRFLDSYRPPSAETVERLRDTLLYHTTLAMPRTAAGQHRLGRLQELLQTS